MTVGSLAALDRARPHLGADARLRRAARWPASAQAVVNVIRGIPIIVQLFYIYFVLPDFGISLTALQAAIIGLGIAYSAYQAENFRAGIEAIDHGPGRGRAIDRHGLVR